MNRNIYMLQKEINAQFHDCGGRGVIPNNLAQWYLYISKHSACDMAHYKVVTNKEHQPFKTAAKGVENLVSFLQQSAGRPPPYRFPPPGHPGGIEADFSRK